MGTVRISLFDHYLDITLSAEKKDYYVTFESLEHLTGLANLQIDRPYNEALEFIKVMAKAGVEPCKLALNIIDKRNIGKLVRQEILKGGINCG